MNTCKTCKWWIQDDGYNEITKPLDPDTCEPMKIPWETRLCKCPKIRFYERPVESNEATICDGSQYYAELCTAEDFGCVLHEKDQTSNKWNTRS